MKSITSSNHVIIFLMGAGAIDNSTYRQLNACDVLRASTELRTLRDKGFINQKGKGKATYYIATDLLNTEPKTLSTEPPAPNTEPDGLITEPHILLQELPSVLRIKIENLSTRENDINKLKDIIYELCSFKPYSTKQIAAILNRNENYLYRTYINPMRIESRLQYTIPDMPNHPDHAYNAHSC